MYGELRKQPAAGSMLKLRGGRTYPCIKSTGCRGIDVTHSLTSGSSSTKDTHARTHTHTNIHPANHHESLSSRLPMLLWGGFVGGCLWVVGTARAVLRVTQARGSRGAGRGLPVMTRGL